MGKGFHIVLKCCDLFFGWPLLSKSTKSKLRPNKANRGADMGSGSTGNVSFPTKQVFARRCSLRSFVGASPLRCV